jgi:hypothetical protein
MVLMGILYVADGGKRSLKSRAIDMCVCDQESVQGTKVRKKEK